MQFPVLHNYYELWSERKEHHDQEKCLSTRSRYTGRRARLLPNQNRHQRDTHQELRLPVAGLETACRDRLIDDLPAGMGAGRCG